MYRPHMLLATLLLTLSAFASAQGIMAMKLLTPSAGWAATGTQLFWTNDNGHTWKNVTPSTASQESIVTVFFLDTSTGWVLFSKYEEPEPRFDLASTADGGASWSVKQVTIPNLNPNATTLSGSGGITFVDRRHGWMSLDVTSGAAFRLAVLIATADGGKTWDWAPGGSGTGGAIGFLNTKVGWEAGGPGGQKLFATYDGANTWQELSLPAPQGSSRAEPMVAWYDLPVFPDGKNGFLPVTYSGPEGSGLTLVLFASADQGQTWKLDRMLPKLPEIYGGIPFPSAVADSTLITAYVTNNTYLTLTTVAPDGKVSTTTTDMLPPKSSVAALSFSGVTLGWVLVGGRLFSTSDGGNTWAEITLRETRPSSK
jgi:photosystem II stability/assembly factor-like uncharacterized protein